MKLTLGFSPCPNDTFIFDALVNKKIDTGEFEFDFVFVLYDYRQTMIDMRLLPHSSSVAGCFYCLRASKFSSLS